MKLSWIKCLEELPEIQDDSVLVFFANTRAIEAVHIEDYFGNITAGLDEDGNQIYTKWYLCQGVTHWMPLPADPEEA